MNQSNSETTKDQYFLELVKITNYNFFRNELFWKKDRGTNFKINIYYDINRCEVFILYKICSLSGVGYHISKVCGKEEVLI